MLVTRDGLGATVQIDPRLVDNAAGQKVQQQAADVAPVKFNDPMWTRTGIDHAKNFITSRWEQRIKQTQAELLARWGGQMKEASGAQKMSCRINARRGYEQLLYPLGITSALGVSFSIDEIKGKGSIEREYQPDYDQRFEADFAIYATSQRQLAKLLGKSLASGSDIYLDLVGANRGINKIISRTTASIRDAMVSGEYTYFIDTYGLNPIPPTTEEITQPGGLKSYYARGGYLISFAAARGQIPAARVGLEYGTGYVLCDGIPAPMLGQVSALLYNAFITVGPVYKLVLRESEPGIANKAVNTIASAMKSLQSIICGSQEILGQLSSNVLLAEQCTLPNGMQCKKGEPGCKCSPPPSRQVSAVEASNKAVGLWCARAQIPDAPLDPGFKPPPMTPFDPPPPAGAWAIPWWLVVGLGVTAGAVAFGKR